MSTVFIARIFQKNMEPVGVGFYIGKNKIITCSHVVDTVAKTSLEGTIQFDFPLSDVKRVFTGRVKFSNSESDIALVGSDETIPQEIEHARLAVKSTDLWGHHFRVFGFPEGYNQGAWASGIITGRQASGWIQIESTKETGYRIQPGFSGSPVWDESYQAVVGMIIAADTDTSIKAAFMIPVDLITKNLPEGFHHENIAIFHEDWGDVITEREFLGREKELATLHSWVQTKNCKIISMIGMGGIGKTALALSLSKSVRDSFDYIFWRDLRNGPAPSGIIGYCIKFISDQQVVDLPEEVDERLSLLSELLKQHRCLIVLDNYETVLMGSQDPGKHKKEFEGYSRLIKRLSQPNHKSLLIITSREKPKELDNAAETCQILNLSGLDETDALTLLQSKKLNASEKDWQELTDKYAGNPLALLQVASTIEELFDGNVSQFLQESVGVFGDIRDLLDEQMDRLPKLGQDIMYWLAIERESVSIPDLAGEVLFWLAIEKEKITVKELHENIRKPVSRRDLLETLDLLYRQSMIEKSGGRFGLQPVVMEYITEQIIERAFDDIMDLSISTIGQYSLIKALSKDHVRESQLKQIVDPLLQKLEIAIGTEQVSEKLLELMNEFRKQKTSSPGYFGGNLLNILARMGYDFTGQDFSNLVIWQAYLDGLTLKNIDFSFCQFDKTIFTDTLGTILCVEFSPDKKYFAAGLANGEIRLWDTVEYKQVGLLRGHTDWVRSIAFSPNGQSLVSCSEDYTLRRWDIDTSDSVVLEGHANRVWNVKFSPNGHLIASCSEDKSIILWDAKTGNILKELKGHEEPVWSCAFSSDNQFLVSASDDKTIRVWDVGLGECVKVLRGHTGYVRSVTFTPDGEKVVSGSDDKTVRVWNVSTAECVGILEGHSHRVKVVRVSPDGSLIVSVGEDHTIRLWDINWGICIKTFQGHTQRVRDITFSPDSITLLSGSDDQTIRLWEVKSGQCIKVIHGYANPILALDISADERIIVTGTEDHAVRIWNTESGQCLATLIGHSKQIWSVAISSDGNKIASASGDETVRIWDINKNKCINILRGHQDRVKSVKFSPDNMTVASCGEDLVIKLWDLKTSECKITLAGHNGWVQTLDFNKSGTRLVSAGDDGVIKVWDLATNTCVKSIAESKPISSVLFCPHDDAIFYGTTDGRVAYFDMNNDKINIFQQLETKVTSISVLPDRQNLAIGLANGDIWVWDYSVNEVRTKISGHSRAVRVVKYNHRRDIISCGDDELIKIWGATNRKLQRTIVLERPYENMNITGVKGLTDSQKITLQTLGAIEENI